ncbi:inorganic phosphate transporter [Alicyclobacillus acidoterrestris]|uniref:Inorganic phosphate transporter n=1 Tax=Alicyclobacillus acidoterrestris (strain ATCC 49025 / DSM 3922 / CIP 106132 / NCIMB 13137 / GD3B) TaxID=1356854 RepID=T0DND3_ALIAG|nr:inorganic phosphate transporter [Alicyclobacillus acidoterrestris]EPZ52882.1 inorganic phosphate transporter [Alicyclobacillus acidoterrestris ATCC 49025]UNO48851.1 inorganic phosphate transporter [Alicyclobacillus acidoterrestris]
MLALIVLVVILALCFDFTNGFHDTANAIATSVSTRALSPRFAVFLAGTMNLIGALTFTGVAKTIGGKIADPLHVPHGTIVVLAAIIAAIAWNLFTWRVGIPSSSSHALIGALSGAVIGAAGFHAINYSGFLSIIEALVISPLAAFCLGYVIMWIFRLLFGARSLHRVNRPFRYLQMVTAGVQAFMHGTNDAQKTMGIITFALIAGGFQTTMNIPFWVKLVCAVAMGCGTATGGWRIIKTVGSKIIRIEPMNGFASDLTSSIIIFGFTLLKLPVSSTHVISSSIMGTGAAKRFNQVHWGVAGRIVIAWLITIPISGCLAAMIVRLFLV